MTYATKQTTLVPGASDSSCAMAAVPAMFVGAGVFGLLAVLCVDLIYAVMQIVRVNWPAVAMVGGAAMAIPLTLVTCRDVRASVLRATIAMVLGLGVLAASLIVSASIAELQYDARWYHLEAVIQLREGWNPVWESCQTRVPDLPDREFVGQKWWRIQCNSKGPYYFGTCAYALTGRIDAAKASGIALLEACLLLWLGLAFTFGSWWERAGGVLLALAVTVSPIVATQWTTAYIDDEMSLLLAILVGTAILAVRGRVSTVVPVAAIALLCATKVTAVFVLGAAIVALVLAMVCLKPCPWRDLHLVRNAGILLGLVLVVCANPLIMNTVRFGHPLYPYNERKGGEGDNLPADLEITPLQRVVLPAMGAFSRSKHQAETMISRKEILSGEHLKNPLSVRASELGPFTNPDVRIGGMGPLFPLALILSLVTGCLLFAGSWKAGVFWIVALGAVYLTLVPSGLGFYARYNPQWWFALFLPLLLSGGFRGALPFRLAAFGLLIVAGINVGLIAYAHGAPVLNTSRGYQRQLATTDRASVYVVDFERFASDRKRLDEFGLRYSEEAIGDRKPVITIGGVDVVRVETK